MIYQNKTSNPSYHYPRLLSKSLSKLNSKIPASFFLRDYQDEKVIGEVMVPENLKSLDLRYFDFIHYVTRYFDCIAVWVKYLTPGGNMLHTIQLWGYYNDFKLCKHYLINLIDSYNHILKKKVQEYKTIKNRALNSSTRKKYNTKDARVKGKNYMGNKIELISKAWKDLEEERTFDSEILIKKFNNLFNIMKKSIKFDYRNYKDKHFSHTFSRAGKFQNNRIIFKN